MWLMFRASKLKMRSMFGNTRRSRVLPGASIDSRLSVIFKVPFSVGAAIFGAAEQIVQVAVVGTEVFDAEHLRFRAAVHNAASCLVHILKGHLVCVLSVPSDSACRKSVICFIRKRVSASVVRVDPALGSCNSRLGLTLDVCALRRREGCLQRRVRVE